MKKYILMKEEDLRRRVVRETGMNADTIEEANEKAAIAADTTGKSHFILEVVEGYGWPSHPPVKLGVGK